MTLPHREPTLEESESLGPVEITNLDNWEPSEHTFLENNPESIIFYDWKTGNEDGPFQGPIQDLEQPTWSTLPDVSSDKPIQSASEGQLLAHKCDFFDILDH